MSRTGRDYESWASYKKLGEYEIYKKRTYTEKVPVLDENGNEKKNENGNTIYEEVERVEWIKTGQIGNIHRGGWHNYTTNYQHNVFINCVISQKNEQIKSDFGMGGVNTTDRVWQQKRLSSWLRVFDYPETDYTCYGSETSLSKRRKSKLREALNTFCAIDNEYELGLTAAEIYSPAYKYADAKAKEASSFWEFFETGSGILSAVLLVVAVIFIWVPGEQPLFAAALANFIGTTAATAATILNTAYTLATIAAFAGNLYYQHTSNKATGLAASASRYSAAKSALQNQMEREKRSKTLTHLIVYGGYSIYANGSVFKEQAAGSQTFSCTIAYDNTKGLRGDLQKDEVAEMIHSRLGGELAGGEKFMSKMLNAEFPLAKASYSAEQKIDMLSMRLKKTIKRVSSGFTKLFENYFNADENGQNTYDRVFKLHTEPIKQQIKNESFLDKIKNYNKNLMADFFYINENYFKSKTKSTEPVWLYFNSETYKAYMDDERYTLEQKAARYIGAMKILFEAIEDRADESFFGNLIYTYASSYSKVDNDGSISWIANKSSVNFALDETQKQIREAHYKYPQGDDSGGVYYTTTKSTPINYLGQSYYSFGYTSGAALYHSADDEIFTLSEFESFDGYFKDDFEQSKLTGDFMIRIFNEALSCFLGLNGKYFCLLRETKSARTSTSAKNSFENEFWAVEVSEKMYNHLTTPLYVPENLKDEFAKFDFSTINIGFSL